MAHIPGLRKHKTGQWFVRWGGKNYYFGQDRDVAESLYLQSLQDWREWKDQKKAVRVLSAKQVPSVIELVEQFIRAKRTEVGWGAEQYYTTHLARFLVICGRYQADTVRPIHLQKLKEMMLLDGLAPKTVNHDLTAVRVLYNWASGLELIRPMSFKGVKNMPLGPPPDKSIPLKEIQKKIKAAPDELRNWLTVNYLALLRPSEVIRCVLGQGKWIETGVFQLDRGKMDKRASFKRHCIFSPAALKALKLCSPRWTHLDSYSHAAVDECDLAPGRLRHSAAMHLVRLYGADPAEVELLLGHVGSRLRVTYYQPAWQALRRTASRLKL